MVYVSSDWHGVPLTTIEKLLAKADFSKSDSLFVLGDVIDRGENGVQLLKWMMLQHNVELILGNHEAMLLKCSYLFDDLSEDPNGFLRAKSISALNFWQSNGGDPTITALYCESFKTRAKILEYLRKARFYYSIRVSDKDYLLVHAGLGNYRDDKKFSEYKTDDFIWTRPTLTTRYSSEYMTILGHTPTGYYGPEFRRRSVRTDTWINIDTGAASGLNPMLLCLDNLNEFYIDE